MNNQRIELRHLESICVTCLVYLATSFSLKPYHQIEKAKPWEKNNQLEFHFPSNDLENYALYYCGDLAFLQTLY